MDTYSAGNEINIGLALTTVAAGSGYRSVSTPKTYTVNGSTTSGVGSATVQIQGSADNITWDPAIGTITLTLGTVATSDSLASMDRYKWVRLNVTAISGTGASINGWIGY